MNINEHSISNHAILYDKWVELMRAYHTVVGDQYMHWCKEDENIERLRSDAEVSLKNYMEAVGSVYFEEANELTELIVKKKKPLFRR